jgi:hypothetical protein
MHQMHGNSLSWLVEDGIKFSHNQNFLCPSASQFMNGSEC